MPLIRGLISPVAFAVCSDNAFTSKATTAKPRPAKKAADEAAAIDADAKIERGRCVDSVKRYFESMIGKIVETVSAASTELEASAGTLTATEGRSQQLTTIVAAASEEASTNVQSVA